MPRRWIFVNDPQRFDFGIFVEKAAVAFFWQVPARPRNLRCLLCAKTVHNRQLSPYKLS